MPRTVARYLPLIALGLAIGTGPTFAAPLFTMSDDGETFLYRAGPGDHPGVVAEMFGIGPQDVDRFLAANGIKDPTRVGQGFVYRIPNPSALRAQRLAEENAQLKKTAEEAEKRVRTLDREASDAKTIAAAAESRAAHLASLEPLWTGAKVVLTVLALTLACAGAVAVAAVRRQQAVARYARTLAAQLEEKERRAMAERQEAGRRVLDLEARIRSLEAQLGPRVVVGGRST